MPKTKPVYPNNPLGFYAIHCPACGIDHLINTRGRNEQNAVWKFSGDMERPSFTPSINIAWGYLSTKATPEQVAEYRRDNIGGRCHFVVTQGTITYCPDCTHALAGQAVPLPEI